MTIPLPVPVPTDDPANQTDDLPALSRSTLDKLAEFQSVAGRALSDETRRALIGDLKRFSAWCERNDRIWMPATPETIIRFIRDTGETYKPASMRRFVSSIATWHSAADLPNPCDTIHVRMELKAHAKHQGVRQRQARGLGSREIEAIITMLDDGPEAEPADLRDKTLLLVARDTLARASELTSLRWEDLERDEDGTATILIRRGKTDQTGEGRIAWLSAEACAALNIWLRHLEKQKEETQSKEEPGPYIFINLAHHGKGAGTLSPRSVARIIKSRVQYITHNEAPYSAHSTRVGAAQDLIASGADIGAVMQAGGWKTAQMVSRYAERLIAKRGAVARMNRKTDPETDPS